MLGSNMSAEMGDMAGGDMSPKAELSSLPMVNMNNGIMTNAPNLDLNGGDANKGSMGGGAASAVKSGISGFFSHMFLFDQKTKCDLMNLTQYSLLGVGPVILMLKTIKNYFPNANESKGTPELALECTLEILFILFCIYYIHRFICYIPTYSNVKYDGVNFTQSVLMFLVILFTIQTKLGTKINILARRATNMVEGYTPLSFREVDDEDDGAGSKGQHVDMAPAMNSIEHTMVSQPIAQPQTSFGPMAPAAAPYGAPAPLVPSSQPGLGGGRGPRASAMGSPRGEGGAMSMPSANDSPSAAEAFSSGSLSGTAW